MTAAPPVSLPSDARTILLAIPGNVMTSTSACLTMAADRDFADPLVLYFTLTRSPETLLDQWREIVGVSPAEFVVLDARDEEADAGELDATVITERSDGLTWFGIHATEYLTRWHERDQPIVICFDSVSTLLEHATPEDVYRFLHVLAGRVETAGGMGFYHIDPERNEEAVVNTMAQLCDCRITCTTDGEEWSVRGR